MALREPHQRCTRATSSSGSPAAGAQRESCARRRRLYRRWQDAPAMSSPVPAPPDVSAHTKVLGPNASSSRQHRPGLKIPPVLPQRSSKRWTCAAAGRRPRRASSISPSSSASSPRPTSASIAPTTPSRRCRLRSTPDTPAHLIPGAVWQRSCSEPGAPRGTSDLRRGQGRYARRRLALQQRRPRIRRRRRPRASRRVADRGPGARARHRRPGAARRADERLAPGEPGRPWARPRRARSARR